MMLSPKSEPLVGDGTRLLDVSPGVLFFPSIQIKKCGEFWDESHFDARQKIVVSNRVL